MRQTDDPTLSLLLAEIRAEQRAQRALLQSINAKLQQPARRISRRDHALLEALLPLVYGVARNTVFNVGELADAGELPGGEALQTWRLHRRTDTRD